MNARVSKSLALVTVAALAACGSSSKDGAPASSVAVGVITGAGLNVNGISFSTAGATSSGDPVAPGRVARVTGVVSGRSGEASEVRIEPIYRGHSGARTPSALGGTVDVRGLRISVDDSTHIEDSGGVTRTFADIDPAGRISVHGFPDDSGTIRASRVDLLGGTGDDFQLKGFVSNRDAGAGTFELRVTPSAPALLVQVGTGVALPQNGAYVEVRSTTPGQNPIVASSITVEDPRFGANREAEIEGIVISGDGDAFVIGLTSVVTSASTRFENGVKADVLPGAKVEAEGSLDGAGVLHARKVSFRANARIVAVPSAVAANSFTLLGKTVHFDAFTRMTGVTLDTVTSFEVRGRLHGNGTDLVAERLEPSGQNKIFVQGPVTAKDATAKTITILGFTVDLSSTSELRNVDDSPMSSAAFFSAISTGTVVKARAVTAGSPLVAEQAEIEGDR